MLDPVRQREDFILGRVGAIVHRRHHGHRRVHDDAARHNDGFGADDVLHTSRQNGNPRDRSRREKEQLHANSDDDNAFFMRKHTKRTRAAVVEYAWKTRVR